MLQNLPKLKAVISFQTTDALYRNAWWWLQIISYLTSLTTIFLTTYSTRCILQDKVMKWRGSREAGGRDWGKIAFGEGPPPHCSSCTSSLLGLWCICTSLLPSGSHSSPCVANELSTNSPFCHWNPEYSTILGLFLCILQYNHASSSVEPLICSQVEAFLP